MGPDLLLLRLGASLVSALGATYIAGTVLTLFRIRDPRLRAAVYALAALDAVLALFGRSCLHGLWITLTTEPQHLHGIVGDVAVPVLATWIIGAAGLAATRIIRLRGLQRDLDVLWRLFPAPAHVERLVESASATARVRPPRIAFVPDERVPFVGGLRTPVLVLSAPLWEHLDHAARHALLLHELAHLSRGHHWIALVTGLVNDLLFPNLLLRRLLSKLRREWESIADRDAIRRGATAAGLARSLFASATGHRSAPALAFGLVGRGRARGVRRRLQLLRRPPRRAALALQLVLVVVAVPWSVLGAPTTAFRPHRPAHDPATHPDPDADRDADRFGAVTVALTLPANPLTRELWRPVVERIITSLEPPRPR